MKTCKYLHIFHDEKFTNIIVDQFLATDVTDQRFIVLYNNDSVQYQLNEDLPIEKVNIHSKQHQDLVEALIDYSHIFLHYLCDLKLKIIELAPKESKLFWMCWGQDIHKLIIPDSYLPKTRSYFLKKKQYKDYFWKYAYWLLWFKFQFSNKKRLIKRINYCCPVIQEDLLLTNERFNLNIKYVPFRYGSLKDILGENSSSPNGNNILIGNSSTNACNHLDVIHSLKKLELVDRRIVIPLSYGNREYGDDIESYAKEVFKDKVQAIRDFMPIEEYNSILDTCSVAIFNHIRQQAFGNIIISLWNGARVYLNSKSLLYKNLKGLGLVIFDVSKDLKAKNEFALERLSKEEVEKNRSILEREFGSDNVIRLTKNVLKLDC